VVKKLFLIFFLICTSAICQIIDFDAVIDKLLFYGTASKTTTNTAAEVSQLPSSYIGTNILPPYFFKEPKIIRIRAYGYLSTSSGQTVTLKIKMNSTILSESSSAIANGLTDQYFEIDYYIVCYSSGVIRGIGRTILHTGTGLSTPAMRDLITTANTTIDYTIPQTLDLTYQWSSASTSNSVTIIACAIELL